MSFYDPSQRGLVSQTLLKYGMNLSPAAQIWYVNGSTTAAQLAPLGVGGSNGGSGQSPQEPFATIDYAVGRCNSNRGDVICVLPGHVETITAASGLAMDVAGVTVLGFGSGSIRPTLNFTTATTATCVVSVANCAMINLLFTGGFDALVSPLNVTGADFKLIDCEYRDVTGQCTDFLLTSAAADRMLVKDLRYDGATAAGTNAGIAIVGGDRITIDGLKMDGNFAVGGVDVRTTATTDLEFRNVQFRTRNAADICLIDTITGSTGLIGPNIQIQLADNGANITEAITGATFVYFGGGAAGPSSSGIDVVNLAGEAAIPINKTQSTDA